MSLFYLNNGQNPLTLIRLINRAEEKVLSTEEFIDNITNNLKIAIENLKEAQSSQERNANKKWREESFELEDKVMLSTKNITAENQTWWSLKKLQPRYIEPYKIVKIILPVNYHLRLPFTMKIHPVFHVSLLKKYVENPEEFFN